MAAAPLSTGRMRHSPYQTVAQAVTAVLLLAAGQRALAAGDLRVRVLDRDGGPVPEVVISARRLGVTLERQAVTATASMNQHDLSFDPHVLAVEARTRIRFPNDDDVRHHVYSFSPAKQFNFSVDSGTVQEEMVFDVAGIVTLGCNIHDEMLAYIVVVDTPYFAMTDLLGGVELTGLPAGRYEITIWSARVAPKNLPGPVEIAVADGGIATWEHRFEARLYPAHRHSETSLQRSRY